MHLHFYENATEVVLLVLLFIVFLQSGIDKIIDFKGNLSWLKGHFSKSILKKSVPVLLISITLFELATALLSLAGLLHLLLHNNKTFVFYGALAACTTLLMLLFGQRIAKDYEGARTIVVYLIPAVFLLFLVQ